MALIFSRSDVWLSLPEFPSVPRAPIRCAANAPQAEQAE
jgi:hypothetical protein